MKKINEMGTRKTGNDMLKCCICGKPMQRDNAHDPYPIRPESWYEEDENRCCEECNCKMVVPIRLQLGRDAGGAKNRKVFRKMSHSDLLDFMKRNDLEVYVPTRAETIAFCEAQGYKWDAESGSWVAA